MIVVQINTSSEIFHNPCNYSGGYVCIMIKVVILATRFQRCNNIIVMFAMTIATTLLCLFIYIRPMNEYISSFDYQNSHLVNRLAIISLM